MGMTTWPLAKLLGSCLFWLKTDFD